LASDHEFRGLRRPAWSGWRSPFGDQYREFPQGFSEAVGIDPEHYVFDRNAIPAGTCNPI
jgi:hypothetical protein